MSQKFCHILLTCRTIRPLQVFCRDHEELWGAEVAWYSLSATRWICKCGEGDPPLWSVRWWGRLILSECYSLDLQMLWRLSTTLECEMLRSPDTLWVLLAGFTSIVKMSKHTGLCGAEVTWYFPSAICRLYGLEYDLWIHNFSPTWARLIVEVFATQAKFLKPSCNCTLINCAFTFHTTNIFSLLPRHYGPLRTGKA